MKKKIFNYYLLLILLILFVTVIFIPQISKKFYTREVENKLESIVFSIEYYLLGIGKNDEIDYDFIAKDYAGKHNRKSTFQGEELRITFISYEGKVLGDSEANFNQMENHLGREEIQEALKGSIGRDIRSSRTLKLDLFYMAIPVEELDVIIRVSVPLVQMKKIDKLIWFYSILIFIAGLIIAVIVSLRIAATVIRPLNNIISVSKEITNGNYSKRITLKSKDELGQLAVHFNEMASKLDKTIFDLNTKKVELESIVESITNGIIAVDNDNTVILINPAAFNALNLDTDAEVVGDNIAQHIGNNQINLLLREAVENNKQFESEVVIDDRVLWVNTSPIRPKNSSPDNSGGIVFIQDITKVRKLEQLRTEFVSNVTHELKTPITSIRGFIETLKNGSINNPVVAERFLEIIDIEAERLHELINDILLLSEIETKLKDTNLESFDLRSTVEDVFKVMQNIAKEKNISLNNNVRDKVMMKANINRMKQLIMNLVDNGIKYNLQNGSVSVDGYREEGKVVVSVKDTGIGIPSSHIPRIFERFYRVDRGRSRGMGGTGLGLSIVKHIVNLYNGDIKVNSIVGEGTEFIIKIPSQE
ncbi:two-component system histidine kinase PnpS [Acetivibrio mesophilus]|uniref:histidine kinase n=1 Tax=Acetivibrio mesophilus TaxID=2487273 RepID=A0A4V1K2M1_9FIRM|nr:ATP-binding protein [Acetivibrio mesophilus]ODM26180.1 PAS domain-containing sensor histidine kinase [Clostridium sp. Bc-iso-3]RXE60769.1 HAMP domain-containing histidine kinase [Acetivibrio mesophilus]HHV28186.1 HAMP domain-containing protein [Clostridium sp.]